MVRSAMVIGFALLSMCWSAFAAAPARADSVDLAVGMPIAIGDNRCSLGFFGFNRRGDRLAVTAGHCSDYYANQPVYSKDRIQIGEVVAWNEDATDSDGRISGSRGYTVFVVYKRFSLQPYFVDVSRSVSEGDNVTKFGARTGRTNGLIEYVNYVPDRPSSSVLVSTLVQIPGDSGCPWHINGPTLVGMGSSANQARLGGDAGSQAQPVGAVIDMIRANGSVWGEDFKVWTQ